MKRGEIWLVECDPSRGSEANKTRPCVIVSNQVGIDVVTRTQKGVLTVVPLTSNTKSVYPFQAFVSAVHSGLPKDSKAQCEQVRAADISRFTNKLGQLSAEQLAAVDDALIVQLGLD